MVSKFRKRPTYVLKISTGSVTLGPRTICTRFIGKLYSLQFRACLHKSLPVDCLAQAYRWETDFMIGLLNYAGKKVVSVAEGEAASFQV